MNLHIDLGQVIISILIGIIGYLIKNEISDFKKILDKHDEMLLDLVQQVQRLVGETSVIHHFERRKAPRN